MLHITIQAPDGRLRQLNAPDECVIGRSAQNEVRLDSWRVAKEHARLFRTSLGVFLEDMGAFGGVMVNGQRIEVQHGPLAPADLIGIGAFKLQVRVAGEPVPTEPSHPLDRAEEALTVTADAAEASPASAMRSGAW